MAQIREIKKRIKAVRNIRRITNTMQMIATARFKSSLDRAVATKPYTRKVRELVTDLAASAGNVEHYLFRTPDPAPEAELVLVLSSDRGLCGAYNSNTLRAATAYLRTEAKSPRLEVVGKKGAIFFRFAGFDVAVHHTQFGEKPQYEDVDGLADRFMNDFEQGKYRKVSVAYMKFVSTGRQTPVVEQLLPLAQPDASSGRGEQPSSTGHVPAGSANAEYDFSPNAESLLAALLPVSVKTTLFQAFNDAIVSEHVARMVAMKAATDNAGKLSKTLRRKFNRARQTQITTELNEIIGGAAGLE